MTQARELPTSHEPRKSPEFFFGTSKFGRGRPPLPKLGGGVAAFLSQRRPSCAVRSLVVRGRLRCKPERRISYFQAPVPFLSLICGCPSLSRKKFVRLNLQLFHPLPCLLLIAGRLHPIARVRCFAIPPELIPWIALS